MTPTRRRSLCPASANVPSTRVSLNSSRGKRSLSSTSVCIVLSRRSLPVRAPCTSARTAPPPAPVTGSNRSVPPAIGIVPCTSWKVVSSVKVMVLAPASTVTVRSVAATAPGAAAAGSSARTATSLRMTIPASRGLTRDLRGCVSLYPQSLGSRHRRAPRSPARGLEARRGRSGLDGERVGDDERHVVAHVVGAHRRHGRHGARPDADLLPRALERGGADGHERAGG